MALSANGLRIHPDWRRQWQAGARSPYPNASPHDLAWRFAREIDRQNPAGTIEDDSIDTGLLPATQTQNEQMARAEPQKPLLHTLEHRHRDGDDAAPLLQRVQGRPETPPEPRPILRNKPEREESLRQDTPALFNIESDDSLRSREYLMPFHGVAAHVVGKHDSIIREEAAAAGIDPDLLRAVMYVENADWEARKDHALEVGKFAKSQGAGDWIGRKVDAAERSRTSVMPMNIQPENWRGLVGADANFDDPRTNIRAGARLLARIRDRIESPTPEKIGSIYNFAGQEKVVNWGEKIARAYEEKAWNHPLPVGPEPNLTGFLPRPLRKRGAQSVP